MRGSRPSDPDAHDAGMTLVEVIVAMTIFALFAAAFAPVILGGLANARRSAVQVTANQTAAEVVDAVVVETTCTAITARGADWASGVDAAGGAHLDVEVVVADCPTTFPATVGVTVRVTGGDASATAATLVLVQGA